MRRLQADTRNAVNNMVHHTTSIPSEEDWMNLIRFFRSGHGGSSTDRVAFAVCFAAPQLYIDEHDDFWTIIANILDIHYSQCGLELDGPKQCS
jgi:hypothetical protein